MVKTAKRELGDWGEEQASLFLIKGGYEIVARNFSVKQGEIDIIAWYTDNYDKLRKLSFIEVKTRTYGDGSAERSVDTEKMKKFFKACHAYCFEFKIESENIPIMFEQISIYVDKMSGKFEIKKYVIPVD